MTAKTVCSQSRLLLGVGVGEGTPPAVRGWLPGRGPGPGHPHGTELRANGFITEAAWPVPSERAVP